MKKRPSLIFFFFLGSGLIFAFIILYHAYVGLYSRLMCDEFFILSIFKKGGFMGSFNYWFFDFTGRFALIITYNLFAMIGPGMIPISTAGFLGLWIASSTWSFSRIFQYFDGTKKILHALFLSLVMIYGTLTLTPNIYQSLYWLPGLLTYALPLLIVPFHFGLIFHFIQTQERTSRTKILRMIFLFLLSVVGSGFSETHAVLVFSGLIMIMVIQYLPVISRRPPQFLSFVIMSTLGTLTALIIQFTAPGNHNRQTYFTANTNPFWVIHESLQYTVSFAGDLLSTYSGTIFLICLVSFVFFMIQAPCMKKDIEPRERKPGITGMMVIVTGGFLLMASCMTPSFYATSQPPLERVQIIPVFVFILLIMYIGYEFSRWVHFLFPVAASNRSLQLILAVVMCLGTAWNGYSTYLAMGYIAAPIKHYAYQWDIREQNILTYKKNGETDIVVAPQQWGWMMGGLDEANTDPNYWVNKYIAEYYGISSLKCKKNYSHPVPHKKRHKTTPQ